MGSVPSDGKATSFNGNSTSSRSSFITIHRAKYSTVRAFHDLPKPCHLTRWQQSFHRGPAISFRLIWKPSISLLCMKGRSMGCHRLLELFNLPHTKVCLNLSPGWVLLHIPLTKPFLIHTYKDSSPHTHTHSLIPQGPSLLGEVGDGGHKGIILFLWHVCETEREICFNKPGLYKIQTTSQYVILGLNFA